MSALQGFDMVKLPEGYTRWTKEEVKQRLHDQKVCRIIITVMFVMIVLCISFCDRGPAYYDTRLDEEKAYEQLEDWWEKKMEEGYKKEPWNRPKR